MKPTTLLIAASLLISTSLPRQAHAVVGMGAVAPASIGYLLAAGASGVMGGLLAYSCIDSIGDSSGECGLGGWSLTVGLLALGVLLLDEGQGPALKYSPLSPAEARQLELGEDQAADYNDSIDEINAIASQVARELASLEKPTAEDSRKAWDRLSTRLPSRAAVEAVAKVSSNWLAQQRSNR